MPPPSPHFIWTDPAGRGRNRFVLFRKTLDLPAAPAEGVLHIFADTRYRLIVNGHTLGHGPARFFITKPEYDTHDLAPFLRAGRNVIAVIVNSYGCVSFHSDLSVGGLIAWGHAADSAGGRIDLASGDAWRAIESPGHHPDTAHLSFALNPGELLDARAMPADWPLPEFDDSAWPPAVLHADPAHWGKLHPRSIPPLDERAILPRRQLSTFAAHSNGDEQVHSLMVIPPAGRGLHTRAKVAVMTFIHSPRQQRITFGAWWGRYWMNGQELKPVARHNDHLRQDFAADLRQGWNALVVYESINQGWWDFYLALPVSAGLSLCAEKMIDCPDTFLIGGPWEDALAQLADRTPWPITAPADLPAALRPWKSWPRTRKANTPARERAWKTFTQLPATHHSSLITHPPSLSFLYDFADEVLGRPLLDFSAAEGTTVDLGYSERLKPDGSADIHNRYFVDMAERYIARAGRQQWHTFHPRGFRYLEVLVTGQLDQFTLHNVALTRANYPVESIGQFECSDPILNEIWQLGQRTQHACMEDAYLDCPWRERGLYSGDFLVQFMVNLAAFGDMRLFRRCIELFFLAQGENGLVPGGCHGLPAGRHPDYSAMIPQALYQYWSRSGDLAFLRDTLPQLNHLLAGLQALPANSDGLMDGEGLDSYIDLCHMDRAGVNCALNCFYQRALADGARILRVVGQSDEAQSLDRRSAALAQVIRNRFWDDARGVFLDRLISDKPDTQPSVPANALPILYDIASPEQSARAVAWLADAMLHNFRVPDPTANADCNVTSYFSFYALGALYKLGQSAAAEQFIRTYWGHMLDQGACTCWEYFVNEPGQSLCHAWSACPVHYLSTEVLGVRFPDPADPNRVEIRPNPGTLQWAAGVYPHPLGPIHVSWRRIGQRLQIDCDAPVGVVTGNR